MRSFVAALALLLTSVQAMAQQPPYPYPPPAYPYPPPYGYPPPPYGYPPAYPPAPPPPPQPPPQPQPPAVVYNWDPDVPVPQGYSMVDGINSRWLVTGITLLGTAWLISLLAGGIGSSGEEEEEDDAADGVTARDWTALYIPVLGPFIAVGTLDPGPSGMGLLLADGVLQVGGAAGIVAGIVDRQYKLVRHGVMGGLSVKPIVLPSFHGVAAAGRF